MMQMQQQMQAMIQQQTANRLMDASNLSLLNNLVETVRKDVQLEMMRQQEEHLDDFIRTRLGIPDRDAQGRMKQECTQ